MIWCWVIVIFYVQIFENRLINTIDKKAYISKRTIPIIVRISNGSLREDILEWPNELNVFSTRLSSLYIVEDDDDS